MPLKHYYFLVANDLTLMGKKEKNHKTKATTHPSLRHTLHPEAHYSSLMYENHPQSKVVLKHSCNTHDVSFMF